MSKELRPNLKFNQLLVWLTSIIFLSSLLSFTGDQPDSKRTDNEYLKKRHKCVNTKPVAPYFDSDPIRFTLRTDKKQVALGAEVTFTITAHYLNINPALLFLAEGSNAFRLKLLLPDGFVQTGGNYSDYVGSELSSVKSTVTYTLKGYFTKAESKSEFRLLRGSGNADETSLFVEKAKLVISVDDHSDQNKNGRLASNDSPAGTCSVSNPNASFDFADCNGIGGWALDQANLSQPVLIDIYVDGVKTYAGITASDDRQDLVQYLGASGRYHGFSYSFPANAPWKNGQSHTISVRICGVNNDIGAKTVNGCTGGTTTNPPTKPPIIDPSSGSCSVSNPNASFDFADCNGIGGWALDQANLNQPVLIDVYVDGVKTYAGITANKDRQDLVQYYGANGRYHGFSYSFPANAPWKNGQNHTISVRICGVNNEIGGSPKTVSDCTGGTNNPTTPTTNPPVDPQTGTCSVSSPNAAFDFVDCNGIGGWALDQTNMNQPVLIDIYVDGVKTYAGVTANNDRQDLVGAFGNSATRYHGFSYSFPANAPWKNGQNHTISVRICGVNNEIGGSPKTVSGCTGGTNNPTTPTTNSPTTNCGTGSGLTGFYTNSPNLSEAPVYIKDGAINFSWGNDSPAPGIVDADFSVLWVGQVEAPVSGNYTLKTNNDDGTRVRINGQLIIDDWNGHGPTWKQGSIYLNSGQKYDIQVEFADFGVGAQAQLHWEYPGQELQIVPACRLYATALLSTQTANGRQGMAICGPRNDYLLGDYIFVTCGGRVTGYSKYEGNGTSSPVPPPSPSASDDPVKSISPTAPLSSGSGGSSTAPSGGSGSQMTSRDQINYAIDLQEFYARMQQRGVSFSNAEKGVLKQYPDLFDQVRDYMDQYGQKPALIYLSLNLNTASDEQIKNAINNLLDPGKPRGMTDLELNLLGFGTPNFAKNLRQYYANAREATLRAVIRYGFHDAMETGTTVANAFKHSLLAIIHARSSFGRQFSKQLVDAHESESPLMDGDMDRYNNEQGFRIYDADPNQSVDWYDNTVWNNVNNGSMRYMVQRLENGEWRWFLIPTN